MSHFNFLEHLFILKQLSCSSGLQPFCLEAAGWMALNWRYLPAKKDNLWGQVESPCPSKSPWFTAEVSVFHQRWRGSSAASGWSVTTAGTTLSTSEQSSVLRTSSGPWRGPSGHPNHGAGDWAALFIGGVGWTLETCCQESAPRQRGEGQDSGFLEVSTIRLVLQWPFY